MKVMYVASGDDKYGAPKSMIDMVRPLKEQYGIEPIILTCSKGKIQEFCLDNHIEEHIVGSSEFMVVGGSNSFRKIVKHSLAPLLAINYLKKRNKAVSNIKKNVELSEIDIIHTNVNRVDSGALIASDYNIPHVWHLREFGKEDYNCMSLIPNYIKYMNEHATAFIAISNVVKEAWVKKGLDKNKIVVINDGITSDGFIKKSEYRKLASEPLKIAFCGLISETKGQKVLIDAVNLLDDKYKKRITIDFYGGGRKEYISYLQDYSTKLGLNNQITFKGYSSNLKEILSKYDVGVVASRAEALGRVTVEYMYAGLYVIASDSGANVDILHDGEYGSLYTSQNSEALADAIIGAFENPTQCKQKAELAEKMAKKRFSMKKNAENIMQLYEDILSKRRNKNYEPRLSKD